jgi:hypothetical protein
MGLFDLFKKKKTVVEIKNVTSENNSSPERIEKKSSQEEFILINPISVEESISVEQIPAKYEKASVENPHYKTWVDVFESANTQIDYWATILKNSERSQRQTTSGQSQSKSFPNYSDTITANGSIAIMTIRSFNSQKIEDDKEDIDLFLNKITNCNYLVIDI